MENSAPGVVAGEARPRSIKVSLSGSGGVSLRLCVSSSYLPYTKPSDDDEGHIRLQLIMTMETLSVTLTGKIQYQELLTGCWRREKAPRRHRTLESWAERRKEHVGLWEPGGPIEGHT